MRIFMDANVLFAAAISPQGRSAVLFLLAQEGLCELLTSSHAVTESRRNLAARYPEAVERFESSLRIVTVVPEATSSRVAWARRHGLPEQDAPILAAAVAARADVLVTGDRTHFGHLLGQIAGGVRVLGLADTLRLLLRVESDK
ncbi:MAG: PIN domain-containing protein [Armatimonadetes bacterium]|nr:PIN domain-containing protein [Armatimonadota bacterium]